MAQINGRILDVVELDKQCCCNEEHEREMVELFLTQARKQLSVMETAPNFAAWREAINVVHRSAKPYVPCVFAITSKLMEVTEGNYETQRDVAIQKLAEQFDRVTREACEVFDS